jgi:nucleotide-binding universal stress UspA family protein
MFKHILVPTDGSQIAEQAAARAIDLAHSVGAGITAVHVSPQFHVFTYRSAMLEETRGEHERDAEVHATGYLDRVRRAAVERGVSCDVVRTVGDNVAHSIMQVAMERGCDLIVMGSHGRHGLGGMLLGSQTQRVLGESAIPVLVCRGSGTS